MIIFNAAQSKLNGAAPWVLAPFTVGSKPVYFYAYGLSDGDKICVRRTVTSGDETGYVSNGCSISAPVVGQVVARQTVDTCGDQLCMEPGKASLQVLEPGSYELIGEGPGFTGGTIVIEQTVWTGEHSPATCPKPVEIGSMPDLVIGEMPDLVIGELPVVEIAKHVVAARESCGKLQYIWSDGTTTFDPTPLEVCPVPVTYCPSMRLSCSGGAGFGFHEMDPKDPAATVELAPCAGDTSTDSSWIYPTAGPGHTVKVADCDGVFIGYAANRSDCAPDCGCPETTVNVTNKFAPVTNVAAPEVFITNRFNPVNNFEPTTNVAAPEVNIDLPEPSLVAMNIGNDGAVTATLSSGETVVSNPLPSC